MPTTRSPIRPKPPPFTNNPASQPARNHADDQKPDHVHQSKPEACGPEKAPSQPLARLIATATQRTQVWVIAHADALINALADSEGCRLLRLERAQGATVLPGQNVLEHAALRWPQG